MEAHSSPLTESRVAVLSRIERVPGSETPPATVRWRKRAPLLAAIALTAIAAASSVLGVSWLAVISLGADRDATAGLQPWAVGCALLALTAFVVGLVALVRPRLRVTLLAVASFLMILLVTAVIGLMMTGASQDPDVRGAAPEALAGHGS
jgi:hypothetical protein